MTRALAGFAIAHVALCVIACGCASGTEAAPQVVFVPSPGEEPSAPAPAPPAVAEAAPSYACPPGSSREGEICVRVVASDIPAWKPPTGHLDPCATWTSDIGLVDCDPDNEFARDPGDAGAPPTARRTPAAR